MKKKNLILIISAVLLIILIFFVIFSGDKKLDINSQEVINLHNSLGEVDINKCGGLITYSDRAMAEADLDAGNRLCKAFYVLNDNQISEEKAKSNEKNSNGMSVCKVSDNISFIAANEEETECNYKIVESKDLKEAYLNIYGSEIINQESFYISDKEACYKEGEKYYCGNAESYKLFIAPEATIYRLIDKAIEYSNGDIVIYDYYLKVSNNKCYSTNTNNENNECSKELADINLENDKETISLVKKYGGYYKHTFNETKNESHYWFQTELVK